VRIKGRWRGKAGRGRLFPLCSPERLPLEPHSRYGVSAQGSTVFLGALTAQQRKPQHTKLPSTVSALSWRSRRRWCGPGKGFYRGTSPISPHRTSLGP